MHNKKFWLEEQKIYIYTVFELLITCLKIKKSFQDGSFETRFDGKNKLYYTKIRDV